MLSASTSDAYSLLFKLLAGAGDEILVPRPSYPLFDHLTRLDEVTAVPYDLEYHDRWTIDMASVERALTPRTRALLIVSPNNPTGSFVKRDELERLAALCAARGRRAHRRRGVRRLRARARRASRRRPRARRAGDAARWLFSLGGLSKSVGLPQVKLGWMAFAGPDALVREALERLELVCDTYLSVSTPVQAAAAELLERAAPVRAQIQARIAANYRRLVEQTAACPPAGCCTPRAAGTASCRCRRSSPRKTSSSPSSNDAGVLVHPGYFFDFPRESFLIVSLLRREAQFAEGVDRVLRHVGLRRVGSHA